MSQWRKELRAKRVSAAPFPQRAEIKAELKRELEKELRR